MENDVGFLPWLEYVLQKHGSDFTTLRCALGVSRNTVNAWKRGAFGAKFRSIKRICEIYGENIEEALNIIGRRNVMGRTGDKY